MAVPVNQKILAEGGKNSQFAVRNSGQIDTHTKNNNVMKKLVTFTFACFALLSLTATAQDVSVDEIIANYLENTGGKDNWAKLEGVKISAKVNQGGIEIPLEIVQLSDGRQYTKFSFQGNEFFQSVYDGEVLWSINFQSLKAEKSDAETTANFKLDLNDFPDSFLNYKDKGYTAELVGTENVDGADTYKVKLTKEPRTIDGQEVADVSFYYFDMDAFVPIAQESEIKSGPQAGAKGWSTMSDYDEVDGFYFPFSLTQGLKGGQSQPLEIEAIEVNPTVDEALFAFPGEE